MLTMEENYNLEEKKLFNTFLDSHLLPLPTNTNCEGKYFPNNQGIELIVRPECNQKCEYCYIYKHGDELYPTRINKEQTLHNIDLVFDYIYHQRKNFLYEIELFAGDMFYDEIYFDILDLCDKYLKEMKQEAPDLFNKQILIACPCNLRWVYEKPEYVNKFRQYYHHFEDEYGAFLSFSWSTDGLYATDTREKKKLDEEYFNTIFKFCKEFLCGYHPMIAAENIKTWCENYDWWLEKYKEFDLTFPRYFMPYMLEVRNDNWTDETIEYHNKFLNHLMKWRLKMCHNNKKELARHLFFGDGKDNSLLALNGCDPLVLWDIQGDRKMNEGMGCSGQDLIHFNCTNLSLVQCHRTSYFQFVPVFFITDEKNEHIIDFKTNNIGSYITWRLNKSENWPICSQCDYLPVCKQGCPGAQFEYSGELYMPIPSLCNYFKKTYDYLYDLYKEYGLIEIALEEGYFNEPNAFFDFIKFKIRQDEEKEREIENE